ncbi:MAG: SDR family NAD(P)-dependent oxidoreductase [Opitutales bacterium]
MEPEPERSVFITGARKGLGRAAAEHYLARGCRVAGCSRRASDLTHERYTHFIADVVDEKTLTAALRDFAKAAGRLDVLVNNAGIAAMNALVLTPGSSARKVLETNTLGAFHALREAGKIMMRQRRGRIVNFSTVAAGLDLEGEAIYAASKAAVESLTRIAAREFGAYGITVNAVAPTPVATDLIKLVPSDKIDALVQRQAIPRLGTFVDVLNVIDFFAAEASDFITGQVIYLGGVRG